MQTTACRNNSDNLVNATFWYLFRYNQCPDLIRNKCLEMQTPNARLEAWCFVC